MTYAEWAILLLAIGVVLAVAEFLLPTHGALGALAAGAILGAVVFCFLINTWLGVAAFAGATFSAPLIFALAVHWMPRTPAGKRLILPPVEHSPLPMPVQIGQIGLAVSELRPMGVCEFSGQRVEVISEYGMIAAGEKVQVVDLQCRRPTVRVV